MASRGHSFKPSKMRFLQSEIEYLGHVSTEEGVKITPRHKKAVSEMPYPIDPNGVVDVTRLRSGIGLFKFCRRHIPKCAWMCAPLNELTTKDQGGKWESTPTRGQMQNRGRSKDQRRRDRSADTLR